VDGIGVTCHFFAAEQIEFDLRPEEVTGPERLAAVVSFLSRLATVVGKPALLTMENMPEEGFLRSDPTCGTVVRGPSEATAN